MQGAVLRQIIVWGNCLATCKNRDMASQPRRITVSDPELPGPYELIERRPDGSLVLRPIREKLSEVLDDTVDAVFVDHEFVRHLERVVASDDDLLADLGE